MSSDAAKLVRAAGAGDDAKVKRLLKAKVNVDSGITESGVSGLSALHKACAFGQVGSAQLLLKAKATVDLRNSRGGSALGAASRMGQLKCAALLLEENALVDIATNAGVVPLMNAAEHGHAPIVKLLLDAKASTSWRA